MAEVEQIVRKSDFAAMCRVSPGRVSQWIAEGKIGPDALVGEGRSARIRVGVANEHLRQRLDTTQRFGLNGITTSIDAAPISIAAPDIRTEPPKQSAAPPPLDTVEERIKREKLRQAELTTRRAEEQDRLSRGVYMLARDARDENFRLAVKMFEAFDGAVTDFAAAFAARYKIPTRDATHLLRGELRKVRERMSAEYGALAAREPETVDDIETHDEIRLQ